MSTIFVTGAAGYIGSHTCLEFLEAGFDVIGLDSLENGSLTAINRVEELAHESIEMHVFDLRDTDRLVELFDKRSIDVVVHFAGLKAVGESVESPLAYYDNNVGSAISLLKAMAVVSLKKFVFSSSCTVYGDPDPAEVPLTEASPVNPVNPYGRTKNIVEQMLKDLCEADTSFAAVALRYFNPIGAHHSGRIGDDPSGVPNNLLPYIMQVATGHRDQVHIFGSDYPTKDGTCVRDYVHVVDVAIGHVSAVGSVERNKGYEVVNLGVGVGTSVNEVLRASELAVGRSIPHEAVDRRAGDAASVYSDPSRALRLLSWKAERDLVSMCRDQWNWHDQNPEGYGR